MTDPLITTAEQFELARLLDKFRLQKHAQAERADAGAIRRLLGEAMAADLVMRVVCDDLRAQKAAG